MALLEKSCIECKRTFFATSKTAKFCSRKCFTSIKRRLFSKIIKSEDGCWRWTGILSRENGYGLLYYIEPIEGKREIHAHRVSWIYHNGPIPNGLWVLHKCDNPKCVNPDHLFIGTCDDNNRDKAIKGRNAKGITHGSKTKPESIVRGEDIGVSKLTSDSVLKIRSMYVPGVFGTGRIAKIFGISKRSIQAIVRRETWVHV